MNYLTKFLPKQALLLLACGAVFLPSFALADPEGGPDGGPGGWHGGGRGPGFGGFRAGHSIIKEFCDKNPTDSRCVEIKNAREQMKQKFQNCRENPSAEGCERINAWRERKEKRCAENPDAPFCKRFQEKTEKTSEAK